MTIAKKRYQGFLLTEMTVALIVLGLILTGLAMSLYGFAKLNKYLLTKQHCICAAEAVLDSITATGYPIGKEDIQRLWPDVNITTLTIDGQGQWDGLKLIKATGIGKISRKEVKVELSRYIHVSPQEER